MSDSEACGSYRLWQPYRTMKSDIEFKFSRNLGDAFEGENLWANAVILQRPVDPLQLRFIKEFKAKGGITIVETDDDLNNIPFSSPAYRIAQGKRQNIYNECIRHADYIHCSTPELAVGNKSTVFLNAIDLSKYTEPLQKDYRCEVFWHGSSTHIDSLNMIKPVIHELLSNGTKVTLMSNKEWLESLFKPHENLSILPFVPFSAFYKIPSMAKVCLAPLPDSKFNRCKSELKILENAAWKVPTVASAVAPYLRFEKNSDGGVVIVKKERVKDWTKAIYSLLEDDQRYKTCSEKSYICIRDFYNLEVINQQRQKWWMEIIK